MQQRSHSFAERTNVLVVGVGPTGATLGAYLVCQGVSGSEKAP
jgi:hypothetical protein